MNRFIGRMATTLLVCTLLLGTALNAKGQDSASTQAPADKSEGYCTQTGGQVGDFYPAYGTNGGNPLKLAGERAFCVYTASDHSQIFLLTSTLYTLQPSLAALAYYSQEQATGNCEGNPASCYCTQLGGSDQFGGTTGAGGGWVDPNNTSFVLEACIMPDMSSIDSWGLYYHSAGIIRGIDLSTVLRYKNPYDASRP
jgi:putative hemolysin